MERLISLGRFVEEQWSMCTRLEQSQSVAMQNCSKYMMFLKQPLTLGMFVPCKLVDGVWVVLEEPKEYANVNEFNDFIKKEKEAKDRVLFEGFEVFKSVSALISFSKNGSGRLDWNIEDGFMMGYSKESTIEDLYNSHYVDLTLTPTAQKQIS